MHIFPKLGWRWLRLSAVGEMVEIIAAALSRITRESAQEDGEYLIAPHLVEKFLDIILNITAIELTSIRASTTSFISKMSWLYARICRRLGQVPSVSCILRPMVSLSSFSEPALNKANRVRHRAP
jgi:hypothetical protein